MKKAKKCLLLACLAAILCTTPVTYANSSMVVTQTSASNSTQVFTIDKAIEYAQKNSKSLASCIASEKYQKSYMDEARLTFKNARKAVNSAFSVGITDINTLLVSNGFLYKSAKLQHRVAQRNTIQQEYMLESKVSQAFYGYLSSKNKVAYATEALKLAQNNASYAQIRYDGGMISENELLNFQIEEINTQNKLNQAIRDSEYSMLNLKTVLSYPLDKELSVTGTFTRKEKSSVTLEQALAEAKKSVTYANIEESYSLAQEKQKKYHGYYSPYQAAWHSAAADFANAELSYQTSIEQLTLGIYSAHSAMLTAYENLEVLDKTLEFTEKQLKAAQISYNSGIMNSNDYISVIQAYNQLKNSLADAELGAYIANVAYESTFDCVNTIFEEDDPLL